MVWELFQRLMGRKPSNPYVGLRTMALASKFEGCVVDMGFPKGSATLVGLSDGTGSMYFSGGGGVIGGHAHPPAHQAAVVLATTVGAMRAHLKEGSAAPLPGDGHWRFYLVGPAGVRLSEEIDAKAMESTSHPMHAAFAAAHGLITQLRLLSSGK